MVGKELKKCVPEMFWTKFIGHTLAISAFFMAYFLVAHHPLFPVTVMPVMAPDRWVPLLPWTVWIYFSLWVYICLPATLIHRPRLLLQYFRGAFWMAAIGIGIFVFWPTSTPQWASDWASFPDTLTFMKSEELSRNACPSLHVSYAIFTWLWLDWLLARIRAGWSWRIGNALWALAIIVTTLTTKQHVFIDVVLGTLFGVMIFAVNMYWVQRDPRLA